MKRPLLVNSIELLLFFVLLAGALLMLSPLSVLLENALLKFRDNLTEKLESSTGFGISYTALSPSIFSSLKVTDLVITDASNGETVARFSDVSVSYDLLDLFRGEPEKALREITVRNGTITVDPVRNKALFDRFASGGKTRNVSDSPEANSGPITLPPLVLRIRNVDLEYTDRQQKLSAHIGTGLSRIDDGNIVFELDSRIRFNRPGLPGLGLLDAGITVKGSVNSTFDSGSASLFFRNLEGDRFSVSRLGLITSFKDGIVSVSSVQDLQPVDIRFLWNIARKEATASLSCDRLLPLRLVTIKNGTSVLSNLRDTEVTGTAEIKVSSSEGIVYAVDMTAEVPGTFLQGGKVTADFKGTSKSVDIRELLVIGENYDIAFNGSVDLGKMMPEGYLSVQKLRIPSGTSVSGEMFIHPEKRGFSCVIPVFTVNTSIFTSVVVDLVPGAQSLEFSLSAYDPLGRITVDGIYNQNTGRFLEFYAALDSVSVANTALTVRGLLRPDDPDAGEDLAASLAPYAVTTELYFSTDFSSMSFNCNRLVFASSERNGIYILLSAKGNENGIDLTDISFVRSGYAISGNIHAGFESPGAILLDSLFTVNTIPYALSGMYGSGQLSLYGDYGVAASLFFDGRGGISGSLSTDGLPVPVGTLLLSLSVNADFLRPSSADWSIILNSGSVQDTSGFMPVSTLAGFKGSMNRTGVFLESLAFTDELSSLAGYAAFTVLPETGGIPRYGFEIRESSAETAESFSMTGKITLAEELYFETELAVTDIPLRRFLKNQQKDNIASFSLSASGTPSSLFASASLDNLVYRIGGFDLETRGKLQLVDRQLSLFEASGTWNAQGFTGLEGKVSLDTLEASLDSRYNGILGKSGLSATIAVKFSPDTINTPDVTGIIPDFKGILSRYSVGTTVSDIRWNAVELKEPLVCTFMHEPGITAFYAGKNETVTGFLLDDGTFSLQSGSGNPVSFYADGLIKNSALSVNVTGFHTDLTVLWPYLGIKSTEFESGSLDGEILIEGLVNDPEFRGLLHATQLKVRAPGLLEYTSDPFGFDIVAEGKILTVPSFVTTAKDGSIVTEAVLQFDRWVPSGLSVKTATLPGKFVKLAADNALFKAAGQASFDLSLVFDHDGLDISGIAGFERGSFAILFSGFTRQSSSGSASPFGIKMNLDIAVGKKVEFRWPTDQIPIIRGLIQADKPIQISLDTVAHSFQLKGEANLKGGEIFYIKRNFYLRQGKITFNENQDIFDPMITFRAEIRERDTEGEPVRIIMSVDNQALSSFLPVLRSDPPKSDAEILALLGQAASGDSSRETILRNTVITASDIFTQMSLFRAGENKLRDVLGLDLFSVRTLILQNAILGPAMQAPTDAPMTIGNYFDDTTVYMGKYLGSAIYADALLHFSYYDPKSVENTGDTQGAFGNLLFQPELGLEVNTPFFLLRWGFTPTSPKTLFVADNSVTLSWKFSY